MSAIYWPDMLMSLDACVCVCVYVCACASAYVCASACACVRACAREAILIFNQLLISTAYSCCGRSLLLHPQLIEIASNMKFIKFVKNVLLNTFNAKICNKFMSS